MTDRSLPTRSKPREAVRCWCGNQDLVPFAESYLRCEVCETLVCTLAPDASTEGVSADRSDFYGESYWTQHQTESFGFPTIVERARIDLPERCLYWLQTLLKYRLPPARLLEIGSSHGGFVHTASLAGFVSTGIEMSPAIVEFSRAAFDVDIRVGPLRRAILPDHTFDVVVSFDVLEHFTDPLEELRRIRRVLKPQGTLMFQTPNFPARDFEELCESGDRFLEHLKAPEHVFLFSQKALAQLLAMSGFENLVFEAPIFDYDSFAIASHEAIVRTEDARAEAALLASPLGRTAQTLLDLYADVRSVRAEADARLAVIDGLKTASDERLALIQELDRACRAQAERIAQLEAQLR